MAASGEITRGSRSALNDDSQDCPAQIDHDDQSHGGNNAIFFDFDQSTGYLPNAIQGPQTLPRILLSSAWQPGTGHLSLEAFLESVASERLNRMPHRASRWDRVTRMLEGMYAPLLSNLQ